MNEPLTSEEKIILNFAPGPDDKRKIDEINKKFAEEDNIINTVYKRPYAGLYLYGNFFPFTHNMKVKFVGNNNFEHETIAFYKNKNKVSCCLGNIL